MKSFVIARGQVQQGSCEARRAEVPHTALLQYSVRWRFSGSNSSSSSSSSSINNDKTPEAAARLAIDWHTALGSTRVVVHGV